MVVDPMAEKFGYETPYSYGGDNPIMNIDIGGRFKFSKSEGANIKQNYPTFYKYITSKGGSEQLAKSDRIISAYLKITKSTNSNDVRRYYKFWSLFN